MCRFTHQSMETRTILSNSMGNYHKMLLMWYTEPWYHKIIVRISTNRKEGAMVDWKASLDNLIHRYSRKTQLRRHPSEMRNGHKTRLGQVEIRPAAQCAEQCDTRGIESKYKLRSTYPISVSWWHHSYWWHLKKNFTINISVISEITTTKWQIVQIKWLII